MSPQPWIAYVGPVAFPEGGAAARRILGNAKALVAAGYDVTIVSGQLPEPGRAAFEVAPGIDCVSVGERDVEYLPRPLRRARYAAMGARTRHWLAARPVPPAAVILYSGYAPYLMQLTGWSRRRAIPLIFDAVEWYLASGRLRLLGSPYHWMFELSMRVLIPRVDGVIAISRALERYFTGRGLTVLRVPPLIDGEEIAPGRPEAGGLPRLAYSGIPGLNKDLIDTVIAAADQAGGHEGRLVLEIAGPTKAELSRRLGGTLPGFIEASGRLDHGEATEVVARADFTVFLRHVDPVSTHGFPTKFVESLTLGTPVITNLTSDLADHLRDGETGLVVAAPETGALAARIAEALAIPPDRRAKMREAARAEAIRAFDYRAHAPDLGAFVETVCARVSRGRRARGGRG